MQTLREVQNARSDLGSHSNQFLSPYRLREFRPARSDLKEQTAGGPTCSQNDLGGRIAPSLGHNDLAGGQTCAQCDLGGIAPCLSPYRLREVRPARNDLRDRIAPFLASTDLAMSDLRAGISGTVEHNVRRPTTTVTQPNRVKSYVLSQLHFVLFDHKVIPTIQLSCS
ncbi:unnamed protein product, partial [Iphiclides podalirius]